MAAQHFFAQGRYLGCRTIPDYRVVPGLEVRWYDSRVLYCMRCGEIWGRLLHDQAPLAQLTIRPCAKHGDGRLACHPTWHDDPTRFEDDWPEAAVRYEYQASLIAVGTNPLHN